MPLRDPGYKLVDQLEYKVVRNDSQSLTKQAHHQFPNGYRIDVVVHRQIYTLHTEYMITVCTYTGAPLPSSNELSGLQTAYSAFAANLILRDIAELE